jgi:hypothetical protein
MIRRTHAVFGKLCHENVELEHVAETMVNAVFLADENDAASGPAHRECGTRPPGGLVRAIWFHEIKVPCRPLSVDNFLQ